MEQSFQLAAACISGRESGGTMWGMQLMAHYPARLDCGSIALYLFRSCFGERTMGYAVFHISNDQHAGIGLTLTEAFS
jgi:hypothetical protein